MESTRDTVVEFTVSPADQVGKVEEREEAEEFHSLLKCLVCGREPASNNYGSITCTSCKVFFLRATTSGARASECQNRQLCSKQDFREKGRSKCIPCRYTKCIEVGMLPEITARRQGCNLRQKRANVGFGTRKGEKTKTEPEEFTIAYSTTPSPDARELQLVATYFKKPIIPNDVKTISDLKGLVELEKYLQNDQPCTSITFDFKYQLNGSMRDAIANPTSICHRVPVGFHLSTNHQVPERYIQSMGGRTFARSLVLISDWIRSIPEFWLLDEVDRVNLCCQQYLPQIIFTDFYYTHKYNYEGFLVLLGTRVSKNDLLLYKELANSMGFLIKFGLSTVIPSMKRANICDEEFVLLKNIILFSSTIGFTDRSAEVMRRAFSKYCSMLFECQKAKFGDETTAIEKFTEAMAHPSYLQGISHKLYAQFGKAVLCKEAGLFGKLPEEVFRKS